MIYELLLEWFVRSYEENHPQNEFIYQLWKKARNAHALFAHVQTPSC